MAPASRPAPAIIPSRAGIVKATPRRGCDPKLLVSVATGLNPAYRNRGAPLLLPLAFKASCPQGVVGGASAPVGGASAHVGGASAHVGGASAPRVTEKPAHARQGLPAEVPAEAGRVVAGRRPPAHR